MKRLLALLFVTFYMTAAHSAALFGRQLVNQEYTADSAKTVSPRASTYEAYTPPASYSLPTSGACRVDTSACSSSAKVKVDVAGKCMCIGGSDCFHVDIGYNGPGMTTDGTGIIGGNVAGAKYQTKSTTSTGYDKDALSMGIEANNRYGKWIHKTRGCTQGGGNRTAGYIAVPCSHWPEIKAQVGQSIQVCNGSSRASSVDGAPRKHRRHSGQ